MVIDVNLNFFRNRNHYFHPFLPCRLPQNIDTITDLFNQFEFFRNKIETTTSQSRPFKKIFKETVDILGRLLHADSNLLNLFHCHSLNSFREYFCCAQEGA